MRVHEIGGGELHNSRHGEKPPRNSPSETAHPVREDCRASVVRHFGSWPEAIYWGVALAMAAAFALTLLFFAFDGRTIDGYVSVWTKPLKFEGALAIHAATLAIVAGLLSAPNRQGIAMLVVALAFLGASAVEMGWIILQGARAEQSHFNVGTPFHRAMYSVMAFCAVIIIGAAGVIGVFAFFDREFVAPSAVRLAIVLGLTGGTLLTVITAFAIGGRMSPYVGGAPPFDSRMILTGWSQSGGDLRVSHFLATHMIQTLPIFGLLVGRILPRHAALLSVLGFAAVWTGLVVTEYFNALAGMASIFAKPWF